MAKTSHWLSDYVVYLAVRGVICLLQILPLTTAYRLARLLAWLAYRVDRRHRLVALDNLRQALPELAEDGARQQLVREVYEHFCQMLVELVHLPRLMHRETWRRYLSLGPRGADVVAALLTGRPVLIVTAHFGNWELAGYVLAMLGFRSYAVARPLDNPFLDDLLRRLRERTGQKLLAKKGDLERMDEILLSGGIVCTLGDQDAGRNGLYVDFFGRPASTHKAMAVLALRSRAIVIVTGARRIASQMRYELVVEDVIDTAPFDADPAWIKPLTQRFTSALERVIRHDPRQYLWLHRRWKHQPQPRGTVKRRAA
jgi:KDO2-lipid IV(A) lauroyltransferase